MLTSDEQNEIMRQDRRRRRQREQAEAIEVWLLEHAPAEVSPSVPNFKGIGIIGKPPVAKASQDCWTTGRNARTRTVGMAPGANPADGPTYRATYADGTTAILPVPSRTRKARHSTKTPQTTELAERNAAARERLAATLAAHPIGNVE